jgi:peptidoglycan/LPS O-acetylase OafA/YrhL
MRVIYRPEIDGLRAVSVFAIILYHANFVLFGHTLFPGGFIGVDIFFVISGYLITTLILKEILETNQFSFKYFYERRIRRILPALLFVTIITSIISYFILFRYSLIDFVKSILSILFFSSNFYFHYSGNNYGSDNALLKPLLHTWSLSVEEQFYILFPIFLIIIIKFFKKHLLTILFVSLLISLFFSQYLSKTHVSFNFYMLLSRGFELLIGSLLCYFELNKNKDRRSYSILNRIFPSIGIALIICSFLFFNFNKISNPSIITLIPLIGVSLIISFSKKGEFITEILSSKIFVFSGLISYSLYLWHYPIFSFLRYIEVFNNSIHIKLLAILLIIILSIFSYYFIEKPFRNKNIITLKKIIIYILISVIILLSYIFYIVKIEEPRSRFSSVIIQELRKEILETNRSKKGNLGEIYLIGDSHAQSLTYYLNESSKKESYNFYNVRTSLYLPNFNEVDRKSKNISKIYLETNNNINKFLEDKSNLIVILHYRWSSKLLETYFDEEEEHKFYQEKKERFTSSYFEPRNISGSSFEERQKYISENLKLTIKKILNQGHILILVYPVPELDFNPARLILKNNLNIINKLKKQNIDIPIYSFSYDIYKKRNKKIFEVLDNIHEPNIYRVYPDKFFCNTVINNRCIANSKEYLFYYDDEHLSFEGSKYIVDDIIKIIKQNKSIKN